MNCIESMDEIKWYRGEDIWLQCSVLEFVLHCSDGAICQYEKY